MWIELQIKEASLNASKSLLVFALLLLVTVCVALFNNGKLSLKIAMAEEQVKIFDSMRLKALASSAREAAECLEYVQNYYPSGTKQAAGSRLNNIVESARAASMREIIAYLQAKTGKDFGDDLSRWKTIESHD